MANQTHYLYNKSNETTSFFLFRRNNVNVTIKPLFCNIYNIPGCFLSPDAKALIMIKSDTIYFFISNEFTFLNIIFNGIDLIFSYNTPQIFLNQTICSTSNLENLASDPITRNCYAENLYFTNNELIYGFFNLEYPMDCSNCPTPTLNIINVEFDLMNSKGYVSLIRILKGGSISIKITNSNFTRSFFSKGLISILDLDDPFYWYLQILDWKNLLTTQNNNFRIFMQGNTISQYNYYNVTLNNPQTEFNIFSFDNTFNNFEFSSEQFLGLNITNDTYLLLKTQNLIKISWFGSQTYVEISNCLFLNNDLQYILNIESLSSFLSVQKSNFLNNSNSGILISSFNNFYFSSNIVSNHILTNQNSLFSFNNTIYIITDVLFENFSSPLLSPSSLFQSITSLNYNEMDIFYVDYSQNYTFDQLNISNVTCSQFEYVAFFSSPATTVSNIFISTSNFLSFFLLYPDQSLLDCRIENLFVVNQTIFENITAKFVLHLEYSRNRTFHDVSYFNSVSSFLFCQMMTPYSFHYMQLYLFNVHIENITVHSSDEVLNLILLTAEYVEDTSDVIIKDCLFKNISFSYFDPNLANSMFTLVNIYYMIVNNFTILEVSNASLIDCFGQTDFPFVPVVNFTDFHISNRFVDCFYFASFYSIVNIFMKNCTFSNEKELSYSVAIYFECFPVCYLAVIDCSFSGIKAAGVIGIKYQNIKKILIVNSTFQNNGGNSSVSNFADISLIFMENLPYLNQIKENDNLISNNFNLYCLDLQNINEENDESSCLNFGNYSDFQPLLIIGEDYPFFNLTSWNLIWSTYGIQNCAFIGSQTNSIYLSDQIDCFLRNNTFSRVSSFYFSSSIYISPSSSLYSYDNKFIECASHANGGVIYMMQTSSAFISNTIFINTLSSVKGGVFYINEANLILLNSIIINSTSDQGGVLYSDSGMFNFTNVTSENTIANLKGGFCFVIFTSSFIANSSIIRSISYYDGGVIIADHPYFFNVFNTLIKECKVLGMGGVYIIGLPNIDVVFENFTCSSNNAMNSACVYMREGKGLITHSVFLNNTAFDNLIFGVSSFSQISFTIMDSLFRDNNLTNRIISFQQSSVSINKVDFHNNFYQSSIISLNFAQFFIDKINVLQSLELLSSESLNAYILSTFSSKGTVGNGQFDSGFAKVGGISIDNSNLKVNNSNFSNCHGISGGALQILDFSDVIIINSIFSQNSAVTGAGIFVLNSYLFSENNLFLQNVASTQGSDIFVSNSLIISSGTITIVTCIFENFHGISTSIADGFLLLLQNNSFYQNLTNNYDFNQALSILDVSNITIIGNWFSNLQGLSAILVKTQIQASRTIVISSSSFLRCSSQNSGGALSLIGNFNLTVNNSEFLYNRAGIYGGAISVSCIGSVCLNYSIFNNSFNNNSAGGYAGALKLPTIMNILFKFNSFKGNTAQVGNILSSNPTQMFITSNLTRLSHTQNLSKPFEYFSSIAHLNVSSGQYSQIYILILDTMNNFLMFDDSGEVDLVIPIDLEERKFVNMKLVNAKAFVRKGVAFFDSFMIIGEPGQNYSGYLIFQNTETSFHQTLKLQMVLCQIGEIFINLKCVPCGMGFYSLDLNSYVSGKNSCDICPPNAVCYGYDYIIPKSGYWRNGESSSVVVQCSNPENCPDQTSFYLNDPKVYSYQCSTGHYGNLCSNCLAGYGKDSNGVCHQCSSDAIIYVRFFVFLVMTLMFLVYQSYVALNFNEKDTMKRSLLKILINHNYYLSFLQNLKVDWIGDLKTFASFSNIYATSIPKDIMNYDCFIPDAIQREDIPITKSVGFSLMPLLLFLILVLVRLLLLLLLRGILKRKSKEKTVEKEIYLILGACLLITVYNFYSRLIMNTLELLKCINIDQTSLTYLELDPNIQCWVDGGYHTFIMKTLFACNFLLWCVGWPLTLSLLLKIKNYTHIRKLMKNLNVMSLQSMASLPRSPSPSNGKKKPSIFASAMKSPSKIDAKKDNVKMAERISIEQVDFQAKSSVFPKDDVKSVEKSSIELKPQAKAKKDNYMQEIIIPNIRSENDIRPPMNKSQFFKIVNAFPAQPSEGLMQSSSLISNDTAIFKKSLFVKSTVKQDGLGSIKSIDSAKSIGSVKSIDLDAKPEPVSLVLDPVQKDKIFHGNKLFRFLTIDYRPDCYFWEGFFYISNLLIATLNVTTSRMDSNSQGGMFISVYFLMMFINEIFKPFRYNLVNKLATFSYLTIIITVGLVLMSLSSVEYAFQSSLYFYLMIILNLVFFMAWGYQFGRLLFIDNVQVLKRFGTMVRKKTSTLLNARVLRMSSINNSIQNSEN